MNSKITEKFEEIKEKYNEKAFYNKCDYVIATISKWGTLEITIHRTCQDSVLYKRFSSLEEFVKFLDD